ncbi:MAG: hypothetical protein KKG10_02375 [Proteobacteria bacterium]|nr:hypothetical protein [Pseudomonadota bacterium]
MGDGFYLDLFLKGALEYSKITDRVFEVGPARETLCCGRETASVSRLL